MTFFKICAILKVSTDFCILKGIHKMKRMISLFLAAVMLLGTFALVACGDSSTSQEDPSMTTPTTTIHDPSTDIPTPDADLYALRVDDMVDPVGIDNKTPNFSWKVNSDRLGGPRNS